MPTAKVTKNVSAATGGGNVLCSTLISIKTKAWLYSFGCTIYKPSSKLTDDENKLELLYSAFVRATCISGREQVWH